MENNNLRVQRPLPAPDRAVDYRAERQRAGSDVVRASRREVLGDGITSVQSGTPVEKPVTTPAVSAVPVTPVTPVAPVTTPSPSVSAVTTPVSAPTPVEPVATPATTANPITPVTPVSTPGAVPPAIGQSTTVQPEKEPSKFRKLLRKIFHPIVGVSAIFLFFGMVSYSAVDMWVAYSDEQTEPYVEMAVRGESTEAATEGSDETVVTASAIDSYEVPADHPRVLLVESLDLQARILPMGVTAENTVQAPTNIFDSGWYTASAKPGEKGMAFIDGHASGATREGLFAYIDTLIFGDIITIERGDGSTLQYVVREVETKKLADIDMTQVLGPRGDITEGLVLMTCTGKWQADQQTYDQRAIVYAERV